MDFSTALNLIAIILSVISLSVAGALAFRQTVMMRHGNQVPVLIELTQQISSEEFQVAEKYILDQLLAECAPNLGVSGLPEGPRIAVTKIAWHFNTLGLMIAQGLVDESLVIPLSGFRIRRLWEVLEPYIEKERELRGDYYSGPFEDLVVRINENHPPAAAYKIKLRRLRPGQSDIVS